MYLLSSIVRKAFMSPLVMMLSCTLEDKWVLICYVIGCAAVGQVAVDSISGEELGGGC